MGSEHDQWLTREIVRLQLAGASAYFQAELDRLKLKGEDTVSRSDMQAAVDAAWDKSGLRDKRNQMIARRALWEEWHA